MHADSVQKNAYGLVYARLFNCAAASLPWRLLRTYLESCANIVQAVVYCPPYRPPSCRQSVVRRVRSRNPSKSTLAHDAVATAVLHKHHPIIRVGAGLIQFVYRSHMRLATEATRNRNAFSPFSREFHERAEDLRQQPRDTRTIRDHLVAYHLAPAITDFISDENRVYCNNDLEQTLTLLHSASEKYTRYTVVSSWSLY